MENRIRPRDARGVASTRSVSGITGGRGRTDGDHSKSARFGRRESGPTLAFRTRRDDALEDCQRPADALRRGAGTRADCGRDKPGLDRRRGRGHVPQRRRANGSEPQRIDPLAGAREQRRLRKLGLVRDRRQGGRPAVVSLERADPGGRRTQRALCRHRARQRVCVRRRQRRDPLADHCARRGRNTKRPAQLRPGRAGDRHHLDAGDRFDRAGRTA